MCTFLFGKNNDRQLVILSATAMAIEAIRELINFAPNSLITLPLLCIGLGIIITALVRRRNFMQHVDKIPGPVAQIPLFGSITDMLVHPDGQKLKNCSFYRRIEVHSLFIQ